MGKCVQYLFLTKLGRGSLVDKVKRITKDSSTSKILHIFFFLKLISTNSLNITHWKARRFHINLSKCLSFCDYKNTLNSGRVQVLWSSHYTSSSEYPTQVFYCYIFYRNLLASLPHALRCSGLQLYSLPFCILWVLSAAMEKIFLIRVFMFIILENYADI